MLEAQEFLVNMKLFMVPHMKDEERQKLHRKQYRLAFPQLFEKPVILTTEQIKQRLAKGR